MAKPRVWFVTGASSGIGRSVTEYILKRGDIVVATLRTPSTLSALVQQYPSSQLLVLKCDVIDYDEVKEAFAQAVKAFKRIDVEFNNAGFGFLAEAEGTPEDYARQMFDVNFWAAANVSREAVRIFRETNAEDSGGSRPGGRLLNNSSTAGPFRTRGFSEFVKLPIHPAYTDSDSTVQQTRAILSDPTRRNPADPELAAEKIYEFAGIEKSPMRFVLGENTPNYVIQKLEKVKEEVEAYKNWSEGIKA